MQHLQSPGSQRGSRHRRPALSLRVMELAVVDLVSTTAAGQIRAARTNRRRAVFVYRTPPVPPAEESSDNSGPSRTDLTRRLMRLRTHQPFSPVGGTTLRPVGDAANTFTLLREMLRGAR